MTVTEDSHPLEPVQSGKAKRTRAQIVAASRQLFLERGYAGTTVNAITEACGISRAGFYTYFKDKLEVFGYLGDSAYRDLRAVLALWDTYPEPRRRSDVLGFVRAYFEYMDRHGAFALAASFSAPDTEDFRRGNTRMQTRVAWILGQAVGAGREHSPEVVGIAALGLLDRGWQTVQLQTIAVDKHEMIALLADTLYGMSAATRH